MFDLSPYFEPTIIMWVSNYYYDKVSKRNIVFNENSIINWQPLLFLYHYFFKALIFDALVSLRLSFHCVCARMILIESPSCWDICTIIYNILYNVLRFEESAWRLYLLNIKTINWTVSHITRIISYLYSLQ